jgi:hypothetical protein
LISHLFFSVFSDETAGHLTNPHISSPFMKFVEQPYAYWDACLQREFQFGLQAKWITNEA